MAQNSEMQNAIEVFARGFCFTRSFTHPYLAERIRSVWVMRNAPRNRQDYRNEEYIAHGVSPENVDQIARKHTRGRYAICAIHGVTEPDEHLRMGYKALNYRLGGTEAVMVHDLRRVPRLRGPADITRVLTEDMAGRLKETAGARQILPEQLVKDAPLRQYVATVDGEMVGWVRSIDVGLATCSKATWCSNMYVKPEFRRRGIAKAMMARMLRDDRAHGSKLAVLTASHTGAMLYPGVGYRQIGTLMLYTPKKR